MRMRWLAVVVVVLLVMGSALLRSHPSSAAAFRDVAVRTQAGAASTPFPADSDSAGASPSDPRSALHGPDAVQAVVVTAQRAVRDAPGSGAVRAPDGTWPGASAADGPSAGPLARRGMAAAPASTSGAQATAMASGTAAANAPAGTALAAGAASGGLQARPTIVKSTAGTATINNAQIEVGFVFDPADNASHRLQFNGPDVAKSEFTLHGEAVSDATIDGQPAVAGQWYPLHAGLTLTAVSPVAVHVRPAAPKTDG